MVVSAHGQGEKPQGGGQSIRRTIAILKSVSQFNARGVRLAEVARDVDLPPPTVHRILAVLQEEAFVSFDLETKLYHLGTALYHLGASTHQFSIRDRYHIALKRISQQTGDAAYLMIGSGYDAVCIERVLGAPIFNTHGRVAVAIPVAGITARMGEERRREIAGVIISEIEAVGPVPV